MNINWTAEKQRAADRLYVGYGITRKALEEAAQTIALKVDQAVQRINEQPFDGRLYVGHSGGKDSVLVQWLADRSDWDARITIHTTKPLGVRNAVHHATKEFLYGLGRPVLNVPEHRMQETLQALALKVQIDGTRAAEADRRDGRDVGLVVNGEAKSRSEIECYMKNGLFGLNFVYPIFDWSDTEVWAAIFVLDIPFSSEYAQ